MTVDSYACGHRNYYIRDQTFDNVYITDEEVTNFETKSALTCFISCEDSQQCKSYSYNALSSVCQHFNVAFWTKSVSGEKQTGWIHYDPPKPQSCEDLFKANYGSGVYTIYPHQVNGLRVKCEMDVDGGRWMVIQHRFDGSVDFQRSWEEYKTGFGNISGEFWIGNENVYDLTSSGKFELRVDINDWEGTSWYAVYKTFNVGDENSQYKLTIGDYSGTAGDSMSYNNGMKFSTVDRDNDLNSDECSKIHGGNGGWWYRSCSTANQNGKYGEAIGYSGIEWTTAKARPSNMKYTRMMIRRV